MSALSGNADAYHQISPAEWKRRLHEAELVLAQAVASIPLFRTLVEAGRAPELRREGPERDLWRNMVSWQQFVIDADWHFSRVPISPHEVQADKFTAPDLIAVLCIAWRAVIERSPVPRVNERITIDEDKETCKRLLGAAEMAQRVQHAMETKEDKDARLEEEIAIRVLNRGINVGNSQCYLVRLLARSFRWFQSMWRVARHAKSTELLDARGNKNEPDPKVETLRRWLEHQTTRDMGTPLHNEAQQLVVMSNWRIGARNTFMAAEHGQTFDHSVHAITENHLSKEERDRVYAQSKLRPWIESERRQITARSMRMWNLLAFTNGIRAETQAQVEFLKQFAIPWYDWDEAAKTEMLSKKVMGVRPRRPLYLEFGDTLFGVQTLDMNVRFYSDPVAALVGWYSLVVADFGGQLTIAHKIQPFGETVGLEKRRRRRHRRHGAIWDDGDEDDDEDEDGDGDAHMREEDEDAVSTSVRVDPDEDEAITDDG